MAHETRWNILAAAMGPEYATKELSAWVPFGTMAQRSNQTRILERVATIGETLPRLVADGRNLLFIGPRGTGKDFMMANLIRKAAQKFGMFARWRNGMAMYSQFRSCQSFRADKTEAEFVAELTEIQILAISDPLPQSGGLSESQSNLMFAVMDERYRQCKPTWMTINVANRQEAEDRLGAQVVDRLFHRSEVLFCDWASYREFERGQQA